MIQTHVRKATQTESIPKTVNNMDTKTRTSELKSGPLIPDRADLTFTNTMPIDVMPSNSTPNVQRESSSDPLLGFHDTFYVESVN